MLSFSSVSEWLPFTQVNSHRRNRLCLSPQKDIINQLGVCLGLFLIIEVDMDEVSDLNLRRVVNHKLVVQKCRI